MGAWGEQPDQSDDFGDAWDKIFGSSANIATELNKLFAKKRLTADERWARIGVVWHLYKSGHVIELDLEFYSIANDDANFLLEEDREWQQRWKSPAKIRQQLIDLIHKFEHLARKRR